MNEDTILGYYGGDKNTPIYPTKRGVLTTQAFILCSRCGGAIKTNGGPSFGAVCVECIDEVRDS